MNEQCLTSSIAFADNKVAPASQNPVNREAAGVKTLVGIICCLFAVTPVLDVELLALSKRKECNCCGNNEPEGKHLVDSVCPRSSRRSRAVFVLGHTYNAALRERHPASVFINIGI